MVLTAATYLGANTVPVFDDLVEQLRSAGLAFGATDWGRSSIEARRHAAEVDLVWMCGALAASMLDAGELDHDIVGAPVFPGESAAVYRSVFVVRDDGPGSLDDALAGSIGINEPQSWSGNHGLRRHLAGRGWFAAEVSTGGHRASIDAVHDGRCDIAGIDSSIWDALVAAEADAVVGLRVVATSSDWPAPPFLIGRGAPAGLTGALVEARPRGLVRIDPATTADYDGMRI